MKLYILEGPDGVGKTTLANDIHEIWKEEGFLSTVVHAGPAETIFEMYRPAYEAQMSGYDVVIMDRSPYSELVYGPLLRNKVIGKARDWIEWRMYAALAEKLLLMDYPTNLVTRAKARGEELSEQQIRQAYLAYCAVDFYSEGFTTYTPKAFPAYLSDVEDEARFTAVTR